MVASYNAFLKLSKVHKASRMPYTATVCYKKLRYLPPLVPLQAAVAKVFMASWSLMPPIAIPSGKAVALIVL